MTLEEHKAILDEMRASAPDEVKAAVTANLMKLENDYRETLAKQNETSEKIAALEKMNKEYAEVNTQLFLQRASNAVKEEIDDTTTPEPEPPAKRKFEDLVL